MAELNKHWTEKSTDDFMYRVGADFVSRIERLLGTQSKASLAKKLGVSAGRISQVLNNPGNLTLKTMIEYARALGLKISVVAYDDSDPKNLNGPVDAEIFEQCWIGYGKPLDFYALNASTPPTSEQYVCVLTPFRQHVAASMEFKKHSGELTDTAANTGSPSVWKLKGEGGGLWPSQHNSFLATRK
jgi:transcriptional regulator with XRE-family HTH domain